MFESGVTDLLETGRRGPTSAMPDMLYTTGAAVAVAGKEEAVAEERRAGVGYSTDEVVEAPTRTVVARPRLLVAMAGAPKSPAELPK